MKTYRVNAQQFEFEWPICVGYFTSELSALQCARQKMQTMNGSQAILGAWWPTPNDLRPDNRHERQIHRWEWRPVSIHLGGLPKMRVTIDEIQVQTYPTLSNGDQFTFTSTVYMNTRN